MFALTYSFLQAEEQWREKCSFMELENAEIRKEEKDLLTEIEEKNAELTKMKAEVIFTIRCTL